MDRAEDTALMEPLVLSAAAPQRGELTDLAVELAVASSGFKRSLPDGVVTALAELVRSMNCYYSNLIEGHDTHPIYIERALQQDYSSDATKRNLQLEATAHISVQKWIDAGGLYGRAMSSSGICEVHRKFCELLPPELLKLEDAETGEVYDVVPGQLRERDVKVGRHVPVSPGAVPRFLDRFEQVYGELGKTDAILSAAAAHHRLLWIHPFLDGNGRVARLMSHALLLEVLDTGAIWSVARGLARSETIYKRKLMACDSTIRNDLDGSGKLSEEALADFIKFFLETCLDQVKFMENLVQPNRLRNRIAVWAEAQVKDNLLPKKSSAVLESVLFGGAVPRSDIPDILGVSERSARRVVSALVEKGVLVADSARAPLRLAFPASLAAEWMPGLFPDKPS